MEYMWVCGSLYGTNKTEITLSTNGLSCSANNFICFSCRSTLLSNLTKFTGVKTKSDDCGRDEVIFCSGSLSSWNQYNKLCVTRHGSACGFHGSLPISAQSCSTGPNTCVSSFYTRISSRESSFIFSMSNFFATIISLSIPTKIGTPAAVHKIVLTREW